MPKSDIESNISLYKDAPWLDEVYFASLFIFPIGLLVNSSVYVFTLIFGDNFFFSILSKFDGDESCTGKLASISPRGP